MTTERGRGTMKNSKEYSKKLQKFYRGLKAKHPKVHKPSYNDPADALIRGIISEKMTKDQAGISARQFADYFVDLNDLRVSRTDEVLEMLGGDTPAMMGIAASIATALSFIFNKYNEVTLESLKKMGKRPAREFLESINGTSKFSVDYCMLTSLQGHAIPLTGDMKAYLKHDHLVHPEADDDDIDSFLTRQISAENAYEFYVLLRLHSESFTAKAAKAVKKPIKTGDAARARRKKTKKEVKRKEVKHKRRG